MTELNYPALASFSLFIIATLFVTAYAARRTRSRQDFYVAGNTIGGIRNGIAISGDYMSAASFMGLVGLFFIGGYDTISFIVNLILSWAVVLLLIAEKLRNLGSYTVADAVSVRLAARPIRRELVPYSDFLCKMIKNLVRHSCPRLSFLRRQESSP